MFVISLFVFYSILVIRLMSEVSGSNTQEAPSEPQEPSEPVQIIIETTKSSSAL